MALDIDGFAILQRIGARPNAFSAVATDVAKAARALVPENLRACRIVMDMCAAGAAHAVMGNHDFNAVCLSVPDRKRAGEYLRPHATKNLDQTKETRDELQRSPREGQAVLNWLRNLPLWLDFDDLRVVHASWSSRAINMLGAYLDSRGAFTDEGLVRASEKGDPIRSAREILLNGVEATPPDARAHPDVDGHMRSEIRLVARIIRAAKQAGASEVVVKIGEQSVIVKLSTPQTKALEPDGEIVL